MDTPFPARSTSTVAAWEDAPPATPTRADPPRAQWRRDGSLFPEANAGEEAASEDFEGEGRFMGTSGGFSWRRVKDVRVFGNRFGRRGKGFPAFVEARRGVTRKSAADPPFPQIGRRKRLSSRGAPC